MIPATKLIQTNTNTSASTTALVVTLGANTTVGNTLFATGGSTGGSLTMSGGGVTTWTQVFFFGSHIGTALFIGIVDGTPSTTITFTYSPAEECVGRVMEFAGKLTTGQSTSASGITTSMSAGAITPAQSNELLISVGNSQSAIGSGPTNSFASQGQLSTTNIKHDTATLTQGAAASISTTWTVTANGWDSCIASFVAPLIPGDSMSVRTQSLLAQ